MSALFRLPASRRTLFRIVSQIAIQYRADALSVGRAGAVHGGDRLPWVPPQPGEPDNFAPLASLRWQVHVYGAAAPPLARGCADRDLPLHVFPFGPTARRAGLLRNALYLVRPDGYVALADPSARLARVEQYFQGRGLHPERPPAPGRELEEHRSRGA